MEVCIDSQWGRVCSASWDNNDATVVCRQLGYSPHGKQILMLTACIDNYHFWSNFTTGATISNGTEFGQGDGPRWLDNVNCDPTRNRTLLECDPMGARYASCHDHDAGVKCRDEQRVKNVVARIVNTPSTSKVYTVLVTWEQNLTVEEPASFKVDCHNEQHRIIITVGNKTLNAQLGGLLSSSYNCCVSAVYPLYEDKEICTGIDTTSNIIMCATRLREISAEPTSRISKCEESRGSNSATIIGGILGFIIVILLSLLSLSVVCLVRQHARKGVISERYLRLQNDNPMHHPA